MFDTTQPSEVQDPQTSSALEALRAFADLHSSALQNAALLLGGNSGLRLVQKALNGLAADSTPTRRTMRALTDLLDLLMLEKVDDLSCVEAAFFAAIDPSDPCVEEICLLADQLSEALHALKEDASRVLVATAPGVAA